MITTFPATVWTPGSAAWTVGVILISAGITFFLRAVPFLAFRGGRLMPEWLEKLGQALPPAIMAVLIVYCLKDAGENWRKIGFPKLLAVFVTAVCYRRTHNTMISIVFGTACYMILLRI